MQTTIYLNRGQPFACNAVKSSSKPQKSAAINIDTIAYFYHMW